MQVFLGALGSSLAVGFGCGSTCGSSASVFLLSYIVTSGREKRENLRSVLSFYIGKCLAVAVLCILSSLAGAAIISTEMAGNPYISRALPAVILTVSVFLLFKTLITSPSGCKSCGRCDTPPKALEYGKRNRDSFLMLPAMGAVYGATPCAPLLLVLGYSALMPVQAAACLGILFSIASCVTPCLLIFGIGNHLSKLILEQVKEHRKYFQIGIYILLILMSLVLLLW